MAEIYELDNEAFGQWLAERPKVIHDLARLLPPNRLYRLDDRRVTLVSYEENGTVTVLVSGEYNLLVCERHVFGVRPEDLTECDLPDAKEPKEVVTSLNLHDLVAGSEG